MVGEGSAAGSGKLPGTALRRLPLLILTFASLLLGMGAGLARLRWNIPLPDRGMLVSHGPLMVGGFLGTVISLERVVGLGAIWGYGAPITFLAASLALVLRPGEAPGPWLLAAGSAWMCVIFIVLLVKHRTVPLALMTVAAFAFLAGNGVLAGGHAVYGAVPLWIAFLVLTIAGERLELNRVLPIKRRKILTFQGILGGALLGALVATSGFLFDSSGGYEAIPGVGDRWTSPLADGGMRLLGLCLLLTGWWLLANDIARKGWRMQGLPRFIAACMLLGYMWLVIAGTLFLWSGSIVSGPRYDAMLHGIFLGFVFSMIFGHAPVIFPGVLGVRMVFSWWSYVPLLMLHLTLLGRVAADLFARDLGRRHGGMGNAASILVFLILTASSVRKRES